ncbi:MAG: hypothetical protein ACXADU_15895 [Promethearchaeota archaeon]|jgi:tRNA A37 methylthiotransferase MiaB
MKQLNSKLIKERSIRLSNVFRNNLARIHKAWINWEGEVLVLHSGNKNAQVFGRNFAYKNVHLGTYDGEFGQFITVRIKRVDGFNLFGKIT